MMDNYDERYEEHLEEEKAKKISFSKIKRHGLSQFGSKFDKWRMFRSVSLYFGS